MHDLLVLGKKEEPKPKLFGPDIFGWGGGLPREGVGAKKFGMKPREATLLGGISRDFCQDIPGAPEKCEKKMVSIFGPMVRAPAC